MRQPSASITRWGRLMVPSWLMAQLAILPIGSSSTGDIFASFAVQSGIRLSKFRLWRALSVIQLAFHANEMPVHRHHTHGGTWGRTGRIGGITFDRHASSPLSIREK